jgi:L,D-transpeptidase catalytic domain
VLFSRTNYAAIGSLPAHHPRLSSSGLLRPKRWCSPRGSEHRGSGNGRLRQKPSDRPLPGFYIKVRNWRFSRDLPPLGHLEIAKKIGAGAPAGSVFKSRKPTGEILAPDAPGRDPIVTRILWLKGLDTQNADAFQRYIYIHGTPEERNIGKPASFGCIRMRSADIIRLFATVGVGAKVEVVPGPLPESTPAIAAGSPNPNQ